MVGVRSLEGRAIIWFVVVWFVLVVVVATGRTALSLGRGVLACRLLLSWLLLRWLPHRGRNPRILLKRVVSHGFFEQEVCRHIFVLLAGEISLGRGRLRKSKTLQTLNGCHFIRRNLN